MEKGFTLIELLVVVTILGILGAVVWFIIDPIEVTQRTRDSLRLSDLVSIQNAVSGATAEATNSVADILCAGGTSGSPAVCSGRSDTGTRTNDGTGWVKVNVGAQKTVSLPTLPIDPINNATYHYTYCSDGNAFEIDTVLESNKFKTKMAEDGGNDNATDNSGRWEVGSDLTLIGASGGKCTF